MSLLTRIRDADDPLPPLGRLVITGAAGRIGRVAVAHFRGRCELLLLDRRIPDGDPRPEEWRTFDLHDPASIRAALEPGDTILHLAAIPSPRAAWDDVLRTNIDGTWHVLDAAIEVGARRVLVASSIHAVSGLPQDVQIREDDPVAPGDLYGVSKATNEAQGRFAAEMRGLPVIAIRIGAFEDAQTAADSRRLDLAALFVSPRDMMQLFERAARDVRIQFAILHGLSRNRFNRMSIDAARELLDYEPVDDFTEINPHFRDIDLWKAVPAHNEARRRPGVGG